MSVDGSNRMEAAQNIVAHFTGLSSAAAAVVADAVPVPPEPETMLLADVNVNLWGGWAARTTLLPHRTDGYLITGIWCYDKLPNGTLPSTFGIDQIDQGNGEPLIYCDMANATDVTVPFNFFDAADNYGILWTNGMQIWDNAGDASGPTVWRTIVLGKAL